MMVQVLPYQCYKFQAHGSDVEELDIFFSTDQRIMPYRVTVTWPTTEKLIVEAIQQELHSEDLEIRNIRASITRIKSTIL